MTAFIDTADRPAKSAVDVLRQVFGDLDDPADLQAARAALEDGAYLASVGLTDADTSAVEDAHARILDAIKCGPAEIILSYTGRLEPLDSDSGRVTDGRCLDAIRGVMSGSEWTCDTLAEVADLVRRTGRHVEDINDF